MKQNNKNKGDIIADLIKNNKRVDSTSDPLFDKYSRKDFPGRNYQPDEQLGEGERRVGNVTSGLNPYTGSWTDKEAIYLLKRIGYGFKKADVDTLVAKSLSNAVDFVLTINNTPPAPPKVWYNNYLVDENGLVDGADWTTDYFNSLSTLGIKTNAYRSYSLSRWSASQALNQDITIREKMAWFWYHFIPIDFNTILASNNLYCANNGSRICYEFLKMYRDMALGNFKTLIEKMSLMPAMMFYLNNEANTNTAPDENFAREVMELFTLGKDPLSQYTQQDVVQAAKVLTGWRVQNLNTPATVTNFIPAFHETSNKQFSSFFNNTVINNNGSQEITDFINMIFSQQPKVVSEYICRRLYRYFVYYDIDANIEANVITPLAQTFVSNNWDIVPVLKQLFKSEHFYDMANKGCYIKSPFDIVFGALRTFNVNTNVSIPSNYDAQYNVWGIVSEYLLDPMGQVMGKVPNVSGWQPFYQKPSYHEYWINSSSTQKRFQFLQYIFDGFDLTFNGLTTHIQVDCVAWIQQFTPAICQDPDLLLNECIKYLLPIDLSQTQKDTIKVQTLLSNQTNNVYWSSAWTTYLSNPSDPTYDFIIRSRLKAMLTTITQLAEYQLM